MLTYVRPAPAAILIGVLLALLFATPPARAAEYTLDWYTIDCGGTMSAAGGNYSLAATIGQPDAGTLSGGTYQLSGGFWFSAAAPPPVACGCGDLDDNDFVNLGDFSLFAGCFGLPAPSGDCPAATFACADLDGSGAIDLIDFSLFSGAFGLPPQGSPPDCD